MMKSWKVLHLRNSPPLPPFSRLDPCTDVKQLKEKPCHEDKTQTLPSVSAETFYNVSSDLKQLLTSELGSRTVGILTDHLEEEGNKDDEEDDAVADEEEEGVVTEVLSHQDDHSCRSFKFSFFDTESTSKTQADMNCTTSRVSKSAPSRSHLHNLHSSSSDDDCDDVQKLQGTDNGVAAVKSFSSRQTGMVTKPPFFFFANDPRLRGVTNTFFCNILFCIEKTNNNINILISCGAGAKWITCIFFYFSS
uniref:Uncharacterized protein n=1 Tax=Eptatretus burgeri TaxID=7764 RepID=A0A8C4N2B0_EPTBU